MGEVILLRKLTEKSKLNFGEYKDYTVQQLIDLKKLHTLRSYYYTLSKISYVNSILEVLMIEDMQIDKPGTDLKSFGYIKEYFQQLIKSNLVELSKKRYKRSVKGKLNKLMRSPKFTKSGLESWNHGHNTKTNKGRLR